MTKKNYNALARAVRCPQCDAAPDEPCWGSLGHPVTYTHYSRRQDAATERRKTEKETRS